MAKIRGPLKPPALSEQFSTVGEFIAAQRRSAELSLRQLAEQTGVSNPYLSQIERGLRRPSAEVLQQLAKALRVSAETLYVRAGILDPLDHPTTTVERAVLADAAISERQKRVLIEVYTSFVEQNLTAASGRPEAPDDPTENPLKKPPKQPAGRNRASASSSQPKKSMAASKKTSASTTAK